MRILELCTKLGIDYHLHETDIRQNLSKEEVRDRRAHDASAKERRLTRKKRRQAQG